MTELNHDLATADNKLATSIDDLGHRFVGKFNLIEDSGNIVNTKLASERLEIDEGAEQIVFGPYVENFKQICREKGAKLSGLWAQYVDVQKEIMELAVTICDDEEVLIGYTQNEGEDVLGMEEEKKNERDNPGIDETRASKQRDIFLSGYDHASRELDELKERVDNMTEQTLKKNADILQVRSVGASRNNEKADTGSRILTRVEKLSLVRFLMCSSRQ